MKKISFLLLISASSLFLSGCWLRKKKDVSLVKASETVITGDEKDKDVSADIQSIEYLDCDKAYEVSEVKTIFADDEEALVEENSIDNTDKEVTFLNQLDMQTAALAEVEKNILENKEKESVGVLYFDFDASQEVKKQSTDTLKLIVNKLNELVVSFPHLEVIVDGHACNSCGSERYNLVLSDDRAKTVKTKIVESTVIPSEKIFETGYGTAHMIVSGNRAEQAPNRRAEVFVILNK